MNVPAFMRSLKDAPPDSSIYAFSSHEFACDTGRAYSELTKLHKRRVEIQARKEHGEANRARTATIYRKLVEASAAEDSFRVCLKDMIPELLACWDHDNADNKINYKSWDESKENSIKGITMDVLLKTAEEIISSS